MIAGDLLNRCVGCGHVTLAVVPREAPSLIIGALTVGNTAPDRERCFTAYEADLREDLNVGAVE